MTEPYGEGPYGAGLYGGVELWTIHPDTGGIPVGAGSGDMVARPGQVQFGAMLLGVGSRAGWRQLVGWRDTADVAVADSLRPQAHGAYAGSVYADAATVTFTFMLRGTPAAKLLALAAIEAHTPLDGVERELVVDDGSGAEYRLGRVIARSIPQDRHFEHGPLECSIQWRCADPRRYALTEQSATVGLPTTTGGLAYPLTYPLDYGTSTAGQRTATNAGNADAPATLVFRGPLTNPELVNLDHWKLGFDLTLGDGETLTVNTSEGTALLAGTADRHYTITTASDPLERCLLAPGDNRLTLLADAGTGSVDVTWHDARL